MLTLGEKKQKLLSHFFEKVFSTNNYLKKYMLFSHFLPDLYQVSS